jgi:type II restriction enzyme
MLNTLIGTKDLRKSVETIWKRDKTAFSVMDILIAVRDNGNKKVLSSNGDIVNLNRFFESVDGVVEYLEGTGLADIFRQGKIKNLVDYVFGIETGLNWGSRF